jgi:hypothetical protein
LLGNPQMVRDAARRTNYDRTSFNMTEDVVEVYERARAEHNAHPR